MKSLEEKLNNLKSQKNVLTTHVELKNYINFLEYLTNKINQENNVLKQLQKELEKISNELLKLNKDKKIIENLKEKEYKLFLNEVNRLEQLKIDEFSIINFYRTKGGEFMKIENVISTNKFVSSNSEKTKLDKGDYFTQIFDRYINDNSNQKTEIDCNNTEIYNLIKNILSLINENNELNKIQNDILSTINTNEGLKDLFINLNSAITNADSLSVTYENFNLNDDPSNVLSNNLYKFLNYINNYVNIKHNESTTSSFDNIQRYIKQQINDLIMKLKLFEPTYQLNYAKNEFLNKINDNLIQSTNVFNEAKQ
ncbi:flagellar export protein FliJ, partial [Thermobrachium celere]|uniref:flagellar export protein FliJ n=1 Tax=Thermobrachium celere TaxID=53422 RepID=UPI001FAEB599